MERIVSMGITYGEDEAQTGAVTAPKVMHQPSDGSGSPGLCS